MRAPKKTGGGTAAAGGTNFQAIVTAIAAAFMLRGRPLGWLEGLADDRPVGIWAESEGPGDDLRIELADGRTLEIQAKKGLSRGNALWDALDSLAHALAVGTIDFGVLAVAPDSSATIKRDLARDIERLGQGRNDMLTAIGRVWLDRLKTAGLDPKEVCARLRIRVVHALSAEDADRRLAKEVLASVCQDSRQADQAWQLLFEQAVGLMEHRGRWDLPGLIRLFHANGIALRAGHSAAGVASRIAHWVRDTNDGFTLAASRKRLPLSALLPMRTVAIPFELPEAETAEQALARYHDGSLGRRRDDDLYDAQWTARFKRRAVIQAGPGLGKSTLATLLAQLYAEDGFPVLRVNLKMVAAAMARGESFAAVLKALALEDSGVSVEAFDHARLADVVVIADGLDDCGAQHEIVARGIRAFATGHPRARVIVTTRPIGYTTAELSQWQHYRLLAPEATAGTYNLAGLLTALGDAASYDDAYKLAQSELGRTAVAEAIKISPLTLGMAASLLRRNGRLPDTRPKLYEQLIALFESGSEIARPDEVSLQVAVYVLNTLGWAIIGSPLVGKAELIERCTDALARELGVTQLAASGIVEGALGYWERVGLVEMVHHEGLELLTFVHKSFAEFAAARYLISLDDSSRAEQLERVLALPEWAEVMTFASGLGYGNVIVRRFLERGSANDDRQMERALAVAIDPDAGVDDANVADVVDMAFRAIADDEPRKYAVGIALAKLAARRPGIVGPAAVKHRGAEDFATALVAWATLVAAGVAYHDPRELEGVLAALLPRADPRYGKPGIFVLSAHDDLDLLETIAIAALEAQPVNTMEAFAERYLRHQAFYTTTFQSQADGVFKTNGLAFKLSGDPLSANRDLFDRFLNPPEDERRLYNRALSALAAAVADAEEGTTATLEYPPDRYIQFAGYLALSGFERVPYDDLDTWSASYDESGVSAAMRAMVAISALDPVALGREAREVVRYLKANPLAKPYALIFPGVDVPEVEWDRAAGLNFDRAKVEGALRHGSKWLAYVTGSLLESLHHSSDDIRRLLNGAKGASLWAGAEMAVEKLPATEAVALLIEPLETMLPKGAEYLFAALRRLAPAMSPALEAAIAKGLDDRYVTTVEQAATLALDLADRGSIIGRDSVRRAYVDWQVHEEKQSRRGVEYPSPLVTLFRLRLAQDDVDDEVLAEALRSTRSDVRKIAEKERGRRKAEVDD